MISGVVRTLSILSVGLVYWCFASGMTGAAEPWDAEAYWRIWYPGSFMISTIAGLILKERGWSAGAVVTLAQAPVMLLNNGAGPLLAVGVLTLCVLAVPVTAVSALAAWCAARARSR